MMASTQPNDQKYKLFFIPSGAWTLKGFGSDVQEHKEVIINILRSLPRESHKKPQ